MTEQQAPQWDDHMPPPDSGHVPDAPETWDDAPDEQELQKIARDAQLPRGTYHTVPEMRINRFVGDDGRRLAFVSGGVVGVDRRTAGKEGRISFRLSPDRRNWDDGRPDTATRLFQQAHAAYVTATGQKPENNEAVLRYVQQYPVALVVIPGKTEPRVVALKAVKG